MSEPIPFDPSSQSGALVPRGPTWTPRAASTQPSAQAGSAITAHFIWRSILRWWKLSLPLGLVVGGAAGAIAWLTLKPLYRAEAWLKIEDRRQFIAFPDQSSARVKTQVELIRSPVVLAKILDQPDIAQFPEIKSQVAQLDWLKDHVQVLAANNSELFQVKFEGPNPANAATIVNKIVEIYLELNSREDRLQTDNTIEELDKQKMRREGELAKLQEKVRELTRQAVGKDPIFVNPNKFVYQSQSPYQVQQDKLATIEFERQIREVQLKVLEKTPDKDPAKEPGAAVYPMVEKAVQADVAVQQLMAQLEKEKEGLRQYEATAKQLKANPDYSRHKRSVETLQESLTKLMADLRKEYTEQLTKQLTEGRQKQIDELRRQMANSRIEEELTRDRLKAEQEELQKLSSHSLDLEFKRADLSREEGVHQKIADRLTVLQTEKFAPAQVSLMRGATIPTLPTTTPTKKVAAATLGGFALPFVLAVVWELRVRRISHVEQIVSEISLPVVGEITTLPVRSMLPGKRAADRFERHRSTFEESIAYVRTSLLLSDDLRELQVLAVASAISREGKSSLASQLAVSLANATGETTLLIDSDMRDPDLHEMFGIELEPGLAQVLEHEVSLDDAVVTTWSRRVHILPAGRLMRSPHVLLGGGAFHALLDEARARYRYIVIDSPPVLAASEALVVAKAADGTLLCTMRDISRVGQVRQANERLRSAGARSLGAVFSGVPPHSYSHKYGGYYSSPYSRRTWTSKESTTEGHAETTDNEEST